jgi:hypothetical protein
MASSNIQYIVLSEIGKKKKNRFVSLNSDLQSGKPISSLLNYGFPVLISRLQGTHCRRLTAGHYRRLTPGHCVD